MRPPQRALLLCLLVATIAGACVASTPTVTFPPGEINPVPSPTAPPAATPSATGTRGPSAAPTEAATPTVSATTATAAPTPSPTAAPTAPPTSAPPGTPAPTASPSPAPTNVTLPAPTQAGLVPGATINAACPLFVLADHVRGTLAGDPTDAAWPVWLVADDGRPRYVRWPEGFAVRFDPQPSLLDGKGRVVAASGSMVDLAQVAPASARGTKEDPYVASGIVFATCYVEQPGASPKPSVNPKPSASTNSTIVVPAPVADGVVAAESITAYTAACDAVGIQNPVRGTLEGDPRNASWPIWLRGPGSRRLYVRYPEGFTVAFTRGSLQLRNEKRHNVAMGGTAITLAQVRADSANGTQADPYIADGILFSDGCYVHR